MSNKYRSKLDFHLRDSTGRIIERRTITITVEAPDIDHAASVTLDALGDFYYSFSVDDLKIIEAFNKRSK